MQFMQHYSGSTVSAPSRSVLMTGQHTGHTPIRGNIEIQPEGQAPLPAEATTLAEVLKTEGYQTGAFGKWGLGIPGSEGDPNKQGFDYFFGYICQRMAHRYYPKYLWNNDEKVMLRGNDWTQKVTYAPDVIQDSTLAFMEKNQDQPFFLYMPLIQPHAELQMPENSIFNRYHGKYSEEPYVNESKGSEYGPDPQFFDSNGKYRGHKRNLYEGGVRVPFIVKWPVVVGEGTTSHHASAFWDILPTLCKVTGADQPNQIDGISFYPELTGNGPQPEHDYLY